MSGTGTETYETVDADVQQSTVATTADTIESVISGAQQIAAFFNTDFAALVSRTGISLGRDLGAEEEYNQDPRLYLNLLCADIGMLLEDQLITGVTLVLYDPAERPDGRRLVRYRAIYTIQRSLALAGPESRKLERSEALDPPAALAGQTRFALIVDWAPNTAERRRWKITTPPYHFQWIPAQTAIFDDSQLAANYRYGSITPTVGDLRVTRVEQAIPSDLR